MTNKSDLIGVKDAAKILGKSRTWVKMLAQSGELPVVTKLEGQTGAYVFSRSVIEHIAKGRAA